VYGTAGRGQIATTRSRGLSGDYRFVVLHLLIEVIKGFLLIAPFAKNGFSSPFISLFITLSFFSCVFVSVERPWRTLTTKEWAPAHNCVICICGTTTIQFVSMQTHCWYNFILPEIQYWKEEVSFYCINDGAKEPTDRLNKKKFRRHLVNFVRIVQLRTMALGRVTRDVYSRSCAFGRLIVTLATW